MRPATTIVQKMIKVDHAGENGAVNIYRAQSLVSNIRCPRLKPKLEEFCEHEKEHRDILAAHLHEAGIRRCISYHLTGLGGYTLGFITGLIGPTAIHATTYAVENVVLEHLKTQMLFLKNHDQAAFGAVQTIYDDEKEHHDTALKQLNEDSLLTKILTTIIRGCTEAVIRFGMR